MHDKIQINDLEDENQVNPISTVVTASRHWRQVKIFVSLSSSKGGGNAV
jgi:hypothetical protein